MNIDPPITPEDPEPTVNPKPTAEQNPGNTTQNQESALPNPEGSVWQRMFQALLDPRSIQWMLTIGGCLCVLGLIVWLVSLGIFKDPLVLAIAMGIGTLAILGVGWLLTLRTKYHMAGQALTFLGCVVAPLNLWFYHAQDLVTLERHLWVGGVVCCLIYLATVKVLRDPLFMYAFEAGVTLTSLLLLADLGKIGDTTFLSLFFMVLGLASLHVERAFSPSPEAQFTRHRFGLPLFWSGQVQVAVSLLILLGSQMLVWLPVPAREWFNYVWAGNLLTQQHLLAGGLWLAGTYAYLYSDIVVRKVGVYLVLAGFTLVMAEVTLLFGYDVSAEWIAVILAITALAVNSIHAQMSSSNKTLNRVLPSVGMVLSYLPILLGVVLHMRTTSLAAAQFQWDVSPSWAMVVAMLVVAVCNRVSAYLTRHIHPKSSAVYFFFSAAGLLIAVAGLLRMLGMTAWSQQAPWMMLLPIVYLIASRLWRGHSAQQPLQWIAHTATVVILVHVFFATLQDLTSFVPMKGETNSLMLGLVFAEATLFYLLAAFFGKQNIYVYLAAAAACGGLWQWMGYYGVDSTYYTLFYAGVGVACLGIARWLGLKQVASQEPQDRNLLMTQGRGLAVFYSGNGILTVACLSAFMQGLTGLAARDAGWPELGALALTMAACLMAAGIVPAESWRRFYLTASVALAGVTFLRLNLLVDLNAWQKLEIFSVVVGLLILIASHVGRFREIQGIRNETVDLGLWLGSLMATLPLLIAFIHHRAFGAGPSLVDEMGLLTVTLLMTVTGVSWQTKSTTLLGGSTLTLYLIVLVWSLAYHPQVAIGVYMAVGGAILFAIGIGLSVYRDRLLELPDQIANREGIFRILSWR
jgi:hypothetical protein